MNCRCFSVRCFLRAGRRFSEVPEVFLFRRADILFGCFVMLPVLGENLRGARTQCEVRGAGCNPTLLDVGRSPGQFYFVLRYQTRSRGIFPSTTEVCSLCARYSTGRKPSRRRTSPKKPRFPSPRAVLTAGSAFRFPQNR